MKKVEIANILQFGLKYALLIGILVGFIVPTVHSSSNGLYSTADFQTSQQITALKTLSPQASGAKSLMNTPFGVVQSDISTFSTDNRSAELMRAAGLSYQQMSFAWQTCEPEAGGGYHWDLFDAAVNFSESWGLPLLPVLGLPPEWAAQNQDSFAAPLSLAAWRVYVADLYDRYYNGSTIRWWQIGKGCNLQEGFHGDFLEEYLPIMNAAAEEIHGKDSKAKVMTVGFAGSDYLSDLDNAIQKIGQSTFNKHYQAIAIEPLWATPGEIAASLSQLDELVEDWYSGEIWITGVGWATRGSYQDEVATEDQQAEYLAKTLIETVSSGISHTLIKTWQDAKPVDTTTSLADADYRDYFGVMDSQVYTKPSYHSVQLISDSIYGTQAARIPVKIAGLGAMAPIRTFLYHMGYGQYRLICWAENDFPFTFELKHEPNTPISLSHYDAYGISTIDIEGGPISITSIPIVIEFTALGKLEATEIVLKVQVDTSFVFFCLVPFAAIIVMTAWITKRPSRLNSSMPKPEKAK